MGTLSSRYSDKAMAARRRKNHAKFLERANEKFKNKFDYSQATYINQKTRVDIICPVHGLFKQSPDKHLQALTGCPKCGIAQRGLLKSEQAKEKFAVFFEQNFAKSLVQLSPYERVDKPIRVRCKANGHESEVSPDTLIHRWTRHLNNCGVCALNAARKNLMLSQNEFIERAKKRFPELNLRSTKYSGIFSVIRFECPIHGKQKREAKSFLDSPKGCSECGRDEMGWTGTRIRLLMEPGKRIKPRPTRIAVMKIKVFDIESLKVGVTSRTLEERYREALKKVYFEAQLNELDALMLELLVHREFKNYSDNRIFYAGMRAGERWGGDTETYWLRAQKKITKFIKLRIKEIEQESPNYWEQYNLEIPEERPRKIHFYTGEWNQPKQVICLDTGEIFSSASDAARAYKASQGNLSAVCNGKARHSKGKRFAYLEDYENGCVPKFVQSRVNRRFVKCLELNRVFPSLEAAAKFVGLSKGSNISKAASGKRKTAGGYSWMFCNEFGETLS